MKIQPKSTSKRATAKPITAVAAVDARAIHRVYCALVFAGRNGTLSESSKMADALAFLRCNKRFSQWGEKALAHALKLANNKHGLGL